jgi:hypothetical protein
MIGKRPRNMNLIDNDELRRHMMKIVRMTDASKAEQDVVMYRLRSIARKRFIRSTIPNLPKTLARDVQQMRGAGVSADTITDFVVQMVPDAEARIQFLMKEAATEIATM